MRYTQIGLATHNRIFPLLAPFDQKIKSLFDFSRARRVEKRGGVIPCGGTLHPFHSHRSMLLGDAAGMVSPLTAGGIHSAIELGHLAGIRIADHLLDGGEAPHVTLRRHVPNFTIKTLMRIAFARLQPPNSCYDQMIQNSWFRHLAQTIFFHHRGLLEPAAWRDILSRPQTPKRAEAKISG